MYGGPELQPVQPVSGNALESEQGDSRNNKTAIYHNALEQQATSAEAEVASELPTRWASMPRSSASEHNALDGTFEAMNRAFDSQPMQLTRNVEFHADRRSQQALEADNEALYTYPNPEATFDVHLPYPDTTYHSRDADAVSPDPARHNGSNKRTHNEIDCDLDEIYKRKKIAFEECEEIRQWYDSLYDSEARTLRDFEQYARELRGEPNPCPNIEVSSAPSSVPAATHSRTQASRTRALISIAQTNANNGPHLTDPLTRRIFELVLPLLAEGGDIVATLKAVAGMVGLGYRATCMRFYRNNFYARELQPLIKSLSPWQPPAEWFVEERNPEKKKEEKKKKNDEGKSKDN
ncbi:hypothetical protein H2203_008586 [Taxawa tesnikishii (nom. ined.)]|nr:hypothetical protein H2203_008586 [Dothideales sp. JES 119]